MVVCGWWLAGLGGSPIYGISGLQAGVRRGRQPGPQIDPHRPEPGDRRITRGKPSIGTTEPLPSHMVDIRSTIVGRLRFTIFAPDVPWPPGSPQSDSFNGPAPDGCRQEDRAGNVPYFLCGREGVGNAKEAGEGWRCLCPLVWMPVGLGRWPLQHGPRPSV